MPCQAAHGQIYPIDLGIEIAPLAQKMWSSLIKKGDAKSQLSRYIAKVNIANFHEANQTKLDD